MNLLASRRGRNILFGTLYLSEGAPIGFLWWALPTQLRAAGVSIVEITTLTSLLALPWALKFLWAPLIDTLQTQRWTLRSWIVSTQLLMGVSLLPLVILDVQSDFPLVVTLLVMHAIAAATQDVSIDALCISSTPPHERGAINGWMQVGMLSGRAVFGGGTLLLAHLLGHNGFVLMLVAVIWGITLIVLLTVPLAESFRQESERRRVKDFVLTLKGAVRQRSTWFGLLFAGIAGAGFESVGAVAGPFMIDRGLTTSQVGIFFSLPSIVGMIVGALIGGVASDWLGRKKAVALFLLALASSIFLLAGFDLANEFDPRRGIFVLLALLYFCIGLFTSSSYALFMDLTDRRLGATQFSAFMGATNVCESWSAFAIGRTVPAFGYPMAMIVMGILSLTAWPLLRFMSPAPRR